MTWLVVTFCAVLGALAVGVAYFHLAGAAIAIPPACIFLLACGLHKK